MKKSLILFLVLVFALSLAACGEDNGGGFTGVSTPASSEQSTDGNGSAAQPPATSQMPTASQPPLGGDPKLLEFCWDLGHLPGNSATVLMFYSNGEFVHVSSWYAQPNKSWQGGAMFTVGGSVMWRERYRGTYSAVNGVLTFTYKSSEQCENPKSSVVKADVNDTTQDWKPYELPEKRSFRYEFRVETSEAYGDRLYLDIYGMLPSFDVIWADVDPEQFTTHEYTPFYSSAISDIHRQK